MSDQLELLPLVAPMSADAPRCRMCIRPARWIRGAEEWGMYCAGRSCSNRDRLCQSCGGTFVMGVDGAGTKYCSAKCKQVGYRPDRTDAAKTGCTWCDAPDPNPRRVRRGFWPYICEKCLDPIKHVADRLKQHRVPHERARQLLTDPGCEVCGTNLLEKIRTHGRNKTIAALVVDHDHDCCPSDAHSCGKCVRGLLCYHCNWAAGQLRDSAVNARSLAAYLDRRKGAA